MGYRESVDGILELGGIEESCIVVAIKVDKYILYWSLAVTLLLTDILWNFIPWMVWIYHCF